MNEKEQLEKALGEIDVDAFVRIYPPGTTPPVRIGWSGEEI